MQKLTIKNQRIDDGRPIICVPVVAVSREEIVREIGALAQKKAQMIEWRVDWFEYAQSPEKVKEVLEQIEPLTKDVIFLFTVRSKRQGGELAVKEENLLQLYELAASSTVVDLIDVEFFEIKHPQKMIRNIQSHKVKVISSHHDFDETPSEEIMTMILEKMAQGGADIVKLAVMPRCVKDVLRLLSATIEIKEKYPSLPLVTMSMGSLGTVSRICGETFGSCITFGSHARCSAPGQLQMEKLEEILNALHEAGIR